MVSNKVHLACRFNTFLEFTFIAHLPLTIYGFKNYLLRDILLFYICYCYNFDLTVDTATMPAWG